MNSIPHTITLVILLWLLVASQSTGATFVPSAIEQLELNGTQYQSAIGSVVGSFERSDGTLGFFDVSAQALIPIENCNGTAIVDVVNSVLFEFPATDELGHLVLPLGRIFLGDDLIAGRGTGSGFTYLSVQWNKLVTDEAGAGMIERGTDGWEVLAQTADMLRDDNFSPACDVQHVLGFGWSQTGKLLAEMLTSGGNQRTVGPVFDGLYLGVAGGRCRTLTDDAFPWAYANCAEPPADHVPTVAFNTESEIQLAFGDGSLRTPSESLSVYDYAGLAHIDAGFLPFAAIFADLANSLGIEFMQNPVSVGPGVRATFWALYEQVAENAAPPESRLMSALPTNDAPVQFLDRRGDPGLLTWSGGAVYTADVDGDGTSDGGVRMPHMPTLTMGGKQVGAPLGTYGGVDFGFAGGPGIFFANGGTFTPFSDDELQALYTNRGSYASRVQRSALALMRDGYLLPEDGMAIIQEAYESLDVQGPKPFR